MGSAGRRQEKWRRMPQRGCQERIICTCRLSKSSVWCVRTFVLNILIVCIFSLVQTIFAGIAILASLVALKSCAIPIIPLPLSVIIPLCTACILRRCTLNAIHDCAWLVYRQKPMFECILYVVENSQNMTLILPWE